MLRRRWRRRVGVMSSMRRRFGLEGADSAGCVPPGFVRAAGGRLPTLQTSDHRNLGGWGNPSLTQERLHALNWSERIRPVLGWLQEATEYGWRDHNYARRSPETGQSSGSTQPCPSPLGAWLNDRIMSQKSHYCGPRITGSDLHATQQDMTGEDACALKHTPHSTVQHCLCVLGKRCIHGLSTMLRVNMKYAHAPCSGVGIIPLRAALPSNLRCALSRALRCPPWHCAEPRGQRRK